MAVVMSAGPQIVTATFLATSQGAKRNSLAFLGGVAVATTIGVTVSDLDRTVRGRSLEHFV
jgi:hypothetical protein